MKYSTLVAAHVETAKRSIAAIARTRDAVECAAALDEVGAVLGKHMEAVNAEAALVREARSTNRRDPHAR